VETPEQNSIVERKHRHILNVTRSLIFHSQIPKSFWSYAACYAIHLINRIPSHVIQNKTPFEKLFGVPPTLVDIRVFGCLCYANTLAQNRTKFDPRARRCVFLGFKFGTKGYIVLDVKTKEISISRNVIFYEHYFPFSVDNDEKASTDTTHEEDYLSFLINDDVQTIPINQELASNDNHHDDSVAAINDEGEVIHEPAQLRRSNRNRVPPKYLTDYHCNLLNGIENETNSYVKYPLNSVLSYNNLTSSHLHYTLSISTNVEPKSYFEAIKSKEWTQAMQEELLALQQNNTWSFTKLPLGKIPIGSKWVYKIKYSVNVKK